MLEIWINLVQSPSTFLFHSKRIQFFNEFDLIKLLMLHSAVLKEN